MTEQQQRHLDVRRASRLATVRMIGAFLLFLTTAIMCFWGWVTMFKMMVS